MASVNNDSCLVLGAGGCPTGLSVMSHQVMLQDGESGLECQAESRARERLLVRGHPFQGPRAVTSGPGRDGREQGRRKPCSLPLTMHSAPLGWGRGPAWPPFHAQTPPRSLSFDPPDRPEVPGGSRSQMGTQAPENQRWPSVPENHAAAKHRLPLTCASSLRPDEASLPACPSRCCCSPRCRQCHPSGDGQAHGPFHSIRLCTPSSPHC